MIPKIFACAMGAAALFAGLTASAAEYRVTFFGTIVEGFDDPGIFGEFGSLAGKPITATYRYDTLTGSRTTDPGVSDMIEPISVSLRIKGVTRSFADFDSIFSYGLAEPGKLTFEKFAAIDADPVWMEEIGTTASSAAFLPDLDLAEGTFVADGSGGFAIDICCCPSCGDDFTEFFTRARFDVDRVRIAVIPEPSTWAMMIIGFGAAGAVVRRRRTAVEA